VVVPCGRVGRVTAPLGGFRPGQYDEPDPDPDEADPECVQCQYPTGESDDGVLRCHHRASTQRADDASPGHTKHTCKRGLLRKKRRDAGMRRVPAFNDAAPLMFRDAAVRARRGV
jgi:hypothetical protein